MPIYAYKCSACGHAKDVLQKISDEPLTQCPACGQATFSKQVTAAGFQLKGSGWYVSDFRSGGDGANSGVGKEPEANNSAKTESKEGAKPDAAASSAPAPTSTPAAAPAPTSAPAPAATPAKASTPAPSSPPASS
jgi:putative FmdB family regulatory protein